MSEIKKEISDLSARLQGGLSIDTGTGTVTAEENLYENALPEDLPPETVRRVSEFNTNFVAAGTDAFAAISSKAMASHKKLNRTEGEIGMIGGKLSVSMERERTYVNRMGDTPVDVIKHGVINVSLETTAGKNGGQLKKVRTMWNETCAELLK